MTERPTMLVQELVGREVFTADGKRLGRVHDVVAERLGDGLCIVGLMVGPAAWLERMGWTRTAYGRMVTWEGIASLEPRITLFPDAEQEEWGMQVVSDASAVTSVLAILFFLTYAAGLRGLPTGHRPKTPTYDRYGHVMDETENPGFQETDEERHD